MLWHEICIFASFDVKSMLRLFGPNYMLLVFLLIYLGAKYAYFIMPTNKLALLMMKQGLVRLTQQQVIHVLVNHHFYEAKNAYFKCFNKAQAAANKRLPRPKKEVMEKVRSMSVDSGI